MWEVGCEDEWAERPSAIPPCLSRLMDSRYGDVLLLLSVTAAFGALLAVSILC
ncbi:MAG: hypothetical protein QUS08_02115 [Methanothrix sp.]|nr:hypothetical protein [Methanothrix sp.]